MLIDEKDYKRIMGKPMSKPTVKNITDLNKYYYWSTKSEEFSLLMKKNSNNKDKYKEYFYQNLLCYMESNKYYKISITDLVLLKALVAYHNKINEVKLKINNRGERV